MDKTKRLVLGLLCACGLAACAGLDIRPVTKPMASAPLPQYKVGDKFLFKDAIVEDPLEVVAVNDKTVTIKSPMFGTRTQYKDFSTPESWTGGMT